MALRCMGLKNTVWRKDFYVKKPMHPEDAAMILEDKDQSFLVFRNASNEKINVLYVTDDGNFGLIET